MSILEFALKTIKAECERHVTCQYCPLYNNYYMQCGVTMTNPADWSLANDNDVVESLFKQED